MSRQPSEATIIRNLRRELASAKVTTALYRQARAELADAQAEANEWKRRFDLLLARTPEVKP